MMSEYKGMHVLAMSMAMGIAAQNFDDAGEVLRIERDTSEDRLFGPTVIQKRPVKQTTEADIARINAAKAKRARKAAKRLAEA